MKKIAILRCLKTSAACAATGCFRAFNEKDNAFKIYEGEDVQLASVWTCNGCGNDMLENQAGIQTKIERMVKNNISVVHLSSCTKKKNEAGKKLLCPNIEDIARKLQALGIMVVEGTHGKQ